MNPKNQNLRQPFTRFSSYLSTLLLLLLVTPTIQGQTVLDTLRSPNEEIDGIFGYSAAGIGGDVNADGVPDVIVGARNEDPGSSPTDAGRVYIVSGADGSLLHTLASPNEEIDGWFGQSVAGVGGDVNADGVPDVIVGAYKEDPDSSPSGAGRAYILSGADGALLHTLASPNEEIDGSFGWSVAGIGGDVNANGVPDIFVGAAWEAPGSSPQDAGRAYIFDVSTSSVGLEELPNGNSITLFPSPTKGSFTLDLRTLQQATVRILSIDGRLLMQKENLPGGQHHVSLRQQAAGLYFVEVLTEQGMEVLKVVKE